MDVYKIDYHCLPRVLLSVTLKGKQENQNQNLTIKTVVKMFFLYEAEVKEKISENNINQCMSVWLLDSV